MCLCHLLIVLDHVPGSEQVCLDMIFYTSRRKMMQESSTCKHNIDYDYRS